MDVWIERKEDGQKKRHGLLAFIIRLSCCFLDYLHTCIEQTWWSVHILRQRHPAFFAALVIFLRERPPCLHHVGVLLSRRSWMSLPRQMPCTASSLSTATERHSSGTRACSSRRDRWSTIPAPRESPRTFVEVLRRSLLTHANSSLGLAVRHIDAIYHILAGRCIVLHCSSNNLKKPCY